MTGATSRAYAALTGAAGASPPEAANGLRHVAALSLTKTADGLIDPKLVLPWALNAAGAPAAFIGALVPIREAGALLPQLAMARKVEAAATRRWFWVAGSAVQGLAALAIAASLLLLDGGAAGWAVVLCLAVLSIARAACSVSHKDALARTIPKRRRGGLTGAAASVAAALVLAFAACLSLGLVPLTLPAIIAAIGIAGAAWLLAAGVFSRLREDADPPEDEPDEAALERLIRPIVEDAHLRRFVLARALLTVTALAPPFILLLSASAQETGLGTLGPLLLASSAAAIVSGWIWGRLSDRSSRLTLVASACLAALVLGGAAAIGLTTGGLLGVAGAATALFLSQIAYEGVRAGRKLHLTDMADDDHRARYTALSNTLIGVVLLLGAGLGVVADMAGPAWVLAIAALLSAAAIPIALSLSEVQSD